MTSNEDQFPIGLKVLLVDDDTICLRLIEGLLKKCNYQVTTTTRAKEALRMLKENRKRFDIVISDVEMPDMDGIKLLQLVGLEMNIPVIMLSTYSDTKRVMQGIRNGACDYLVKPVRIQELQNIWQHVLRRKKSMPILQGAHDAGGSASAPGSAGKGKASSSRDVMHENKGKGIQESSGNGNNEDDDDDDDGSEDGGRDNDDPTAQKKPRFFWSVDVHQKFVDAVKQLGPDKAFPKKILDLMDVEGLTREKVASHLQKYRLYLRKVNSESGQSANRYGGFGAEDPHIGSLGGGYGVYRSLAGPGRFPGLTSPPDQTGGMLGRLNTASGLSLRGISSSAMLHSPQLPNSSNSFNTMGKLEPLCSSGIQNPNNTFQGISNTMPMNKTPLFGPPNSPMMLNGNQPLNTREFSNHSSLISSSSNSGGLGFGVTPNLLDPNSKSNWQTPGLSAAQPLSLPSNVLPTTTSSDGIASASSQMQSDPMDIFGGISALDDSNRNMHNQDCLSALSNFNNIGHSQIWPDHKPDYVLNPSNVSSPSSGLVTSIASAAVENARKSNNSMIGASPFGQLEGGSSQSLQQNEVQKSNNSENILLDDPKLVCGAGQSSSEYLEDIVGRFLQQGNEDTARARDDLGLDPFLMQ